MRGTNPTGSTATTASTLKWHFKSTTKQVMFRSKFSWTTSVKPVLLGETIYKTVNWNQKSANLSLSWAGSVVKSADDPKIDNWSKRPCGRCGRGRGVAKSMSVNEKFWIFKREWNFFAIDACGKNQRRGDIPPVPGHTSALRALDLFHSF